MVNFSSVIGSWQWVSRSSNSSFFAAARFFLLFSAWSFFCWFLWNFSKFWAMIGIGRDKTSTPDTAQMVPTSFPRPGNVGNVKFTFLRTVSNLILGICLHSQLLSLWWRPNRTRLGWKWNQSHCQSQWSSRDCQWWVHWYTWGRWEDLTPCNCVGAYRRLLVAQGSDVQVSKHEQVWKSWKLAKYHPRTLQHLGPLLELLQCQPWSSWMGK